MKRICVFCGSSIGNRASYGAAARELGQELANRRLSLVYGGGNVGLMGIIAQEVLTTGEEVVGVIPEFLMEQESAHLNLTTLHVVRSMHERKTLMADLSDAFIALPGGYGTIEEFCEMVTWKQLRLHQKPCGVINIDGFFDGLLKFFDHQVNEGFVTTVNRALVMEAKSPSDLFDQLAQP